MLKVSAKIWAADKGNSRKPVSLIWEEQKHLARKLSDNKVIRQTRNREVRQLVKAG